MEHARCNITLSMRLTAKGFRLSTRRSSKDVWTRVLGHLDTSELKAARLISCTSRTASIASIKSLPFERCPHHEDSLTSCLKVFSSVTSIALNIQSPEQANLIYLPEVRSKLSKLRLSFPLKNAKTGTAARETVANRCLNGLIANLSLAAHLTSLELYRLVLPSYDDTMMMRPGSVAQHQLLVLLHNLGACGALRELILDVEVLHDDGHTAVEAVLGLTSLRTLHINRSFPWGKLFEEPTRLTHQLGSSGHD
jgi:hypothetical protein